ncbi:MAG: hypothetical protein KDA96_23490 [Planctomycetaceae bacterium]|nr:hypothetical protein [Planctomycetaceae bacterium]
MKGSLMSSVAKWMACFAVVLAIGCGGGNTVEIPDNPTEKPPSAPSRDGLPEPPGAPGDTTE